MKRLWEIVKRAENGTLFIVYERTESMEQIGLIGYGDMADMIARRLLRHGKIKENELFIETRTKGSG